MEGGTISARTAEGCVSSREQLPDGTILGPWVVIWVGDQRRFRSPCKRVDASDDVAPLACALLVGVQQSTEAHTQQIFRCCDSETLQGPQRAFQRYSIGLDLLTQ